MFTKSDLNHYRIKIQSKKMCFDLPEVAQMSPAVNVIKTFLLRYSSSNKLECFYLASLFDLVWHLLVKPGSN